VFTYRGKAIDKASTKAWKDALVRAGIKNFRWHDWRHTWASWHRMSGTPTDVLQQLGGWKTQAMVERYAHQHPGYLAQFAASFKPFDGHEIVDEPGQAKTGS
ncbi:MAG TPA: tyrosine-type recombinase/integrase, partial [Burkholderiales bacterium]